MIIKYQSQNLMKLEDMTPAMQAEAERVDVEAKASAEKIKRSRRPSLNILLRWEFLREVVWTSLMPTTSVQF